MEGDDHYNWLYATLDGISIHSLRMEGDAQRSSHTPDRRYFNPLPPHGGRLCNTLFRSFCVPYFNPLPPHGGRHPACHTAQGREDFNPLPPHGGRRFVLIRFPGTFHFNPLPPHGGRPNSAAGVVDHNIFQSTPSAWRETWQCLHFHLGHAISIHSLRMEGDNNLQTWNYENSISIHSLRMEGDLIWMYQSREHTGISIHSLRMEGD